MAPSWLSLPALPTPTTSRHLLYGLLAGLALSITTSTVTSYSNERKRKQTQTAYDARPIELRSDEVVNGVTGLIGS